MTRARDVADTQENLGGGVPPFVAGKNAIINGDFLINQRAFTSTTSSSYGFDRWTLSLSGGTATYSAQTFTAGAAPVAGYESKNFARVVATVGNDYCKLDQRIESVRTLAGQTVTVSFWAKGTNPATLGSLNVTMVQSFGSGGSPSAAVIQNFGSFVLTANWTRYTLTSTVPSISGKTLGTNNDDNLGFGFGQGSNASTDSWTLDIWGIQLEAGNVATPFTTATGTIQGELAACQRYFCRLVNGANNVNEFITSGMNYSTSQSVLVLRYPFQMRATPTISFSNQTHFALYASNAAASATTGIVADFITSVSTRLSTTVSGVPFLGGNATLLFANSSSATLDASAEL